MIETVFDNSSKIICKIYISFTSHTHITHFPINLNVFLSIYKSLETGSYNIELR